MLSKRLDPDVRDDALLAIVFGIVSCGLPFALARQLGARIDTVAAPGVFRAFGCAVAAVFAISIARRPRFELVFDFDERTLEVRSLGLFARSIMRSRIEPNSQVFRQSDNGDVFLLSVGDDGVEKRVTPPMPVEHFDALAMFRARINETDVDELGSMSSREARVRGTLLGRTLTSARLWWGLSAALITCAVVHVAGELRF
ncbi:MAG: hypothetical protein JNK05_04975 [Myxococcales bacterium]|nr:hypothetical protein [Myxococcales bacterium]